MRIKTKIVFSALFLLSMNAFATRYTLPEANNSIIGSLQYSSIGSEDNIINLQKSYNIGYNAIENANPHLNLSRDFPASSPIVIPTEHLLPNEPRVGIVINLPEMRMYYYPANSTNVYTYPIGIGKIGKTIPITKTAITRKVKDPIWVPPADIREFNLQQGIVLPSVMPSGPDNPLGPYAIYMKVPTYLIHSTIFPESVGKRASFGCIRMYESDIQEFFPTIQRGIPVTIVNSPAKVGWDDEHLYIEAHKPLQEHEHEFNASLGGIVHLIADNTNLQTTLIDWQMVAFISEDRDGLPHEIGVNIK